MKDQKLFTKDGSQPTHLVASYKACSHQDIGDNYISDHTSRQYWLFIWLHLT